MTGTHQERSEPTRRRVIGALAATVPAALAGCPSYLPTANREETDQYVLGGTPAGYAEADATFWPRALETLRGT